MMENPIKMDDLGVPLFLETPTYKSHPGSHPQPFVSRRTGLSAVLYKVLQLYSRQVVWGWPVGSGECHRGLDNLREGLRKNLQIFHLGSVYIS